MCLKKFELTSLLPEMTLLQCLQGTLTVPLQSSGKVKWLKIDDILLSSLCLPHASSMYLKVTCWDLLNMSTYILTNEKAEIFEKVLYVSRSYWTNGVSYFRITHLLSWYEELTVKLQSSFCTWLSVIFFNCNGSGALEKAPPRPLMMIAIRE